MRYPDLEGKTVVITGANRGIGKGLAKAFANNRCQVVMICRSATPEVPSVAVGAPAPILLESDIADLPRISSWLADFEQSGKSVDVLINNAAVRKQRPLIDVDEGDWDFTFETNLKRTFFLAQLFARHMKEHSGGVIINAHSFGAAIPATPYGLYSASKSGLAMLTRIMAAEWAPYGIRVNAYSPGVVETDMTAPGIQANRGQLLGSISLKRFGTVEEVASAVLFLASDAASYVTGVDLDISGGKFLIQNAQSLELQRGDPSETRSNTTEQSEANE